MEQPVLERALQETSDGGRASGARCRRDDPDPERRMSVKMLHDLIALRLSIRSERRSPSPLLGWTPDASTRKM